MKQIIFFLSFFPLLCFGIEGGFTDEFYKLSTEKRIQVFSEKINEMLDISFQKVLEEKKFVEDFFKKHSANGFRTLENSELEILLSLKEKYRVQYLFNSKEYKEKIGVIPKSMGIAQAMIESATGTSRFTKEANNLFGEWTWGGKGLIPKKRAKGKTHKIKIFDTLQESVDSYVLNLNRHNAYKDFRTLRLKYAKENKKFTGLEAIKTLQNYSEIKGEYTKRLRTLITRYKLSRFE